MKFTEQILKGLNEGFVDLMKNVYIVDHVYGQL